jgi:putative ABC transport system substrate-binding protein
VDRREFLLGVAASSLARVPAAAAQPAAKTYRIGVVLEGGPYYAAVDGLKAGLKELGLEDGKQYVLDVRDVKGDLGAVAETAKNLEQQKVDLIYSTANSVTLAVRKGTTKVPIIFYAGSDPVRTGLVKSFARPGGRITGIFTRSADLVAKRLQILKEAVPKVRRVVIFYDPENPGARESMKAARDAAGQFQLDLLERHVRSVDELRAGLEGLKPGDADAIFLVLDAMVNSQVRLIADQAKTKKVPTMFYERGAVAAGGLASYGVSYHAVGQRTAMYVHRVLLGASPADLPVEGFDRIELVINLKTAKALGLTIPPAVLARADEVIQ